MTSRAPSRFGVLQRLFSHSAPAASGPLAWLVVGLGNPGARYAETRHNIGQRVVEALAAAQGSTVDEQRSKARFGRATVADAAIGLVIPITYMNLSGDAVAPLSRFYKVPPSRILVVFDDLDLPVGKLRLRHEGGAGGHNGMKSLIERLGTQSFPRLRIGIGRPPAGRDSADYVLSRFSPAEAETVDLTIRSAVDAIRTVIERGVERAMNEVNSP